jgi:hypothetical protein
MTLQSHSTEAVNRFAVNCIVGTKRRDASVRSQSTFLHAADEFIAQHAELL